jgi:diguanylate cyclase (GGDEF)-like protein
MIFFKQQKKILLFIAIPLLALIPFFTNDFLLKLISLLALVIYAGFIVFVRKAGRLTDSSAQEEEIVNNIPLQQSQPVDVQLSQSNESREYNDYNGESFKIISPNKKIEIIKADTYVPELKTVKKDILLPPDLKEAYKKIANEALPQEVGDDDQFTFVLEKLLSVIKDSYMAHTAAFFFYNREAEKLTLQKYSSDSKEISEKKIDIEDDLLSTIVRKEEPQLLTDITTTAEKDVLRYYTAPQGIKSFVGVPLFFGNQLAGILCLDAKANDTFGIETIYSLGRYVRVMSIIIGMFGKRHSGTVAEKRLNGLMNLINNESIYGSLNDLYEALEMATKAIVSWDAFVFVHYQPAEQKFRAVKVINNTEEKYIEENLDVELEGTLAGKSIISGMPLKYDNTSAEKNTRYAASEKISFSGSFMAIPLAYGNQVYGVLCFESLKIKAYSDADVKFIRASMKMLSFIIYSFSTQAMLRSYLAVDIETKALNLDYFKNRLLGDIYKAKQLNLPGSVALICIDNFLEQESLFEGNPFPKVLRTISQMIQEEMTPNNLFGRVDERTFAVYFFNVPSKDVFVWAEQLRQKIARKPIAVVSKQTTFTVSIGVASTANKVDVAEIMTNADLALRKALEKGNSVKSVN